MMTTPDNRRAVIFDLDDTLFPEIDYLHSSFREIDRRLAASGVTRPGEALAIMTGTDGNAFDALALMLDRRGHADALSIPGMVEIYRNHRPDIALPADSLATLEGLKARGIEMGIITDGRVGTQSAKIEALGLGRFIDRRHIIISEAIGHDKLSPEPFIMMQRAMPGVEKFTYVGDNPAKDFTWPDRLGWDTVCLRSHGQNIHPQPLDRLPSSTVIIDRLTDLLN